MVSSTPDRRWHRRRKAANIPTTEELKANPTAYGHVGNGRMAIPVEDWLALVEAFGAGNVAIYDEKGDSVDPGTQVGDILEDQVIAPIDPWYDRLIWLWFFAGWVPPTFAITQGWWAWGGPVMALWVVTGVVIVATFIGGAWNSCRRCGTSRASPPRPWRR